MHLNLRISQDAKVSVAKPLNEFETKFSTNQSIHSTRRKLHHAISILDRTLDLLVKLVAHAELVDKVMNVSLSASTVLQMELDQISSEMKSHRSVAQSLLQLSGDIRFMVSHTCKPFLSNCC